MRSLPKPTVHRLAAALVRLGRQVADPDTVEVSNIDRQFGATIGHVGRSKAEAVAELVHDATCDVNIDVFPEGTRAWTTRCGCSAPTSTYVLVLRHTDDDAAGQALQVSHPPPCGRPVSTCRATCRSWASTTCPSPPT